MDKIFKVLGGQKFTCLLVLLALITPFFALGKLSEPGFVDLTKWGFVVFVLGHTGTNIAALIKGK